MQRLTLPNLRARRWPLRIIAIVLAGFPIQTCNDPGLTSPVRPVQYDFSSLTTLIQSTLDTLDFADSAAVILIQHGSVIYEAEFGGLTIDAQVPIASAAKWLTAATVLSLVDEGTLDLDGAMDEYLPDNFHLGSAGTGKGSITIRQLLSLTSGLAITHPCIYQSGKTLEECAVDIGSRALVASPGAAFVYGQAAFTVAGAAAELEAERSWSEIFDRKMSKPLEFRNTHFLGGQNPQLGDGAISTVREYSKFLTMILAKGVYGGRRVLSQDVVVEMLQDQTDGARVVFSPRNSSVHYGLGVWIDRPGTGGAGAAISSPGSLGFVPWIDLERNLVGVLAVPPHLDRTGELADLILQRINEIVPVGSDQSSNYQRSVF